MLFPIAVDLSGKRKGFQAFVPDFKDCEVTGETIEEALKNAERAIYCKLEELSSLNGPIPKPNPLQYYLVDPKIKKGHMWFMTSIDMSLALGKAMNYNISVPKNLTQRIDAAVQNNERFKSRSSFLAEAAVLLLSTID